MGATGTGVKEIERDTDKSFLKERERKRASPDINWGDQTTLRERERERARPDDSRGDKTALRDERI